MTNPVLVFAHDNEGRSELVVNFGVFSGRGATEAEVYRLGHALLDDHEPVEIVSEHRYELDRDAEATVHQLRVRLPRSAEGRERELSELIRRWAEECIGERRLLTP
jgi:hypothetical protein